MIERESVNNYQIYKPSLADAEEIKKFHDSLSLETHTIDNINESLEDPNKVNWAAKNEDGKIIAWLECSIQKEKHKCSFSLHINEEDRVTGIRSKLLIEVLNLIYSSMPEINRIEINLSHNNDKNIAYYEGIGFVRNDENDKPIMEKDLFI